METTPNRTRQRKVRLRGASLPMDAEPASGDRSVLTRRRFLAGTTAATAATAAGAAALLGAAPVPVSAHRDCSPGAPRPVPVGDPLLAGLDLHVWLPRAGVEPSTIFDFHGKVAIVDLVGDCVRTVNGGPEQEMAFRADLRIMEGTYIGLDGRTHRDTFGFV